MKATYSINRVSPLKRWLRKIQLWTTEWWKDEYIVNHKSSYKKMIRLLRRGIDKEGKRIDIRKFDSLSARTLQNLYEEVRSLDVVLIYNPKTRRVEHHAQKVTVLVRNISMNLHWLEVSRRYPNGTVIEKEQRFTIRETRKRNMSPIEAVMSGLMQELKYFPLKEEIEPVEVFEGPADPHESSVYYGILSIDTILEYIVNSKTFYRKDGHVIKDYGDGEPDSENNNWVEATIKCFSS